MFQALEAPNSKNEREPSTQNKQSGANPLTADEKLAFLVKKGIGVLQTNWQKHLQENGQKLYFVAFDVPETTHEGILKIEKETRMGREENYLLSIGVRQQGSRRLHSNCLCHGHGQEGLEKVLAYLNRPELGKELCASVKELSRHVDQDDYD